MKKLWTDIVTLEAFHKKNRLPEVPGVYFFLDAKKRLLYIGKATSLRDRAKSYFTQGLGGMRGPKIVLMLERTRFIAYQRTDSVLEALILEVSLIKAHQPPYNTDAKDDKSYQHVVITRERFPRVLLVRGRDIEQQKFTGPAKYIFGPFPSGSALREALKIIRKLFPYRDRCTPYAELSLKQQAKARPCFSAQIGLCPGVCMGSVSAREYGRTINHIRLFFEGRKHMIIRGLEREMQTAAKHLAFERAGDIKKTIFGLRHIQDMALLKDDQQLTVSSQQKTMRIEAYDVAHLGGDASVGVMVTIQGGKPDKESYRKFILRGAHNGNDLSALEEILKRRLKHSEWTFPEIIVVDGALLQYDVAAEVLRSFGLTIPIVGVVKNAKHQPERLIGEEALTKRFKKEILLANSEAHRFAITFHRKRRSQEFMPP